MALSLTYGTMSAGKSTLALQLHFQLVHSGRSVQLWTFGDRSGAGRVTSRIGVDAPATVLTPGADMSSVIAAVLAIRVEVLVVDEVQFASVAQIDELARLVDDYGVDVHCFGLGADFLLTPFAGTARLFAIADEVSELPLATYCWCGDRGRCNARVVNGEVSRSGDQQVIGDTASAHSVDAVSYQVLCRRHYRSGQLR